MDVRCRPQCRQRAVGSGGDKRFDYSAFPSSKCAWQRSCTPIWTASRHCYNHVSVGSDRRCYRTKCYVISNHHYAAIAGVRVHCSGRFRCTDFRYECQRKTVAARRDNGTAFDGWVWAVCAWRLGNGRRFGLGGGPTNASGWLAAFSLLGAGILLGPLALWWSRVFPTELRSRKRPS